jgi:hypothetical protein
MGASRQHVLLQVTNKTLYESSRRPAPHGCLDSRLGTSQKNATCGTCGAHPRSPIPLLSSAGVCAPLRESAVVASGEQLATCVGHFGYIQLELPVFHVGLFKDTWTILQERTSVQARRLAPVISGGSHALSAPPGSDWPKKGGPPLPHLRRDCARPSDLRVARASHHIGASLVTKSARLARA